MRPRLMRTAMRYLDADTANDVAIAALHTMWMKDLRSPRDQSEMLRLQALAYRVVEGHVRNARRSAGRQARLFQAVAHDQSTRPSDSTNVSDWVDQTDANDQVRILVESLPRHEREVVVLVIDGFSVSEIAEILDRTTGAISMRLTRARKRLRMVLEAQNGEE